MYLLLGGGDPAGVHARPPGGRGVLPRALRGLRRADAGRHPRPLVIVVVIVIMIMIIVVIVIIIVIILMIIIIIIMIIIVIVIVSAFTHLFRFDACYYTAFGCDTRTLAGNNDDNSINNKDNHDNDSNCNSNINDTS